MRRLFGLALLCLSAPLAAWGRKGSEGSAMPERLRISDEEVLDPEGKPLLLRGFNWGFWDRQTEEDADLMVKHMPRANFIRFVFRWYRDKDTPIAARQSDAPGHINPKHLEVLDRDLAWLTDRKFWVLLEVEAGGGSSRPENFWNSSELKTEFVEMWEFLARRYQRKSYMGIYGILAEPHPPDPVSHKQVSDFYREVIDRLHAIDERALFVIGAKPFYSAEDLTDAYYLAKYKSRIIYCFNILVDGEKMGLKSYPGAPEVAYYRDKKGIKRVDGAWLEQVVRSPESFRKMHKVPVFCDQYGVTSDIENYVTGLGEIVELLQKKRIHSTYWTWRATDKFGIRTTKGETNEKLWKFFSQAMAK